MIDFAAKLQDTAKEKDPFNENVSGAIFSDCGDYRYLLWRMIPGTTTGERMLFVMLNPSTANQQTNDPTVSKCLALAEANGFSGIEVVNLFGFQSSQPKSLVELNGDPIGRLNEMYIAQAARRADMIVCAWGNNADLVQGQATKVLELLVSKLRKTVYHLGLTAKGHPKHPLARGKHRIPDDFAPVLWKEPPPAVLRNPKAVALDTERRSLSVPATSGGAIVAAAMYPSQKKPKKTSFSLSGSGVFNEWEVVGEICTVCDEPQRQTPSGPVCKNGHGGAEGRLPVVAIGPDGEPEDDEPNRSDLAPEPPAWEPSKDQQAALDGILRWWGRNPGDTTTLGGYAGTGKTTLMGKLAYDLLSDDVRVVFATPTGKAAQVLTRSLRASGVLHAAVSTIHSLIYIPKTDPATGRVTGWQRRKHLDADLIVLDEASMVTREMLNDLEYFRVPILAVGDHGQLPPVGEKAFLMAQPDFRLEKIHRQAKGNPIIRLATHMRKGAPPEAWKALIDDLEDERIQYTTMAAVGRAFGAPPGMAITYTNRLRCDINGDIREDIHGLNEEQGPQPGEIVICLKNHKLDEYGTTMIANGMRGVVKSCEDGNSQWLYRMDIEFDEPVGLVENLAVNKSQFGRDKTYKGWDEVPGKHHNWWTVGALFDFGYALTCHKAQGSQADNVAIFMENWALDRQSEEDRRRWCYTAATRAAEQLMLVF